MNTVVDEQQVSLSEFLELKIALEKSKLECAELKVEIESEREKYKNLLRALYGKKSEKISEPAPGQGELFDEAENESAAIPNPEPIVISMPKKPVNGKKRGRKSIPVSLPRIDKVIDLTEKERDCPFCDKSRPKMGEERTEEIDFIPAHVQVTVYVRNKYGPCDCDGFAASEEKEIIIAPAPAKIVPGSAFSNRAIAFFIVAKYVDGLPFYRQESMMPRYSIEMGRGTMAHLSIRTASRFDRIVALMQGHIRASPVVGMDETVVQVLKEKGRKPESQSRMWVARGYHGEKPILLFVYNPSRSGAVASGILGDFKGFLQTDGHAGYNSVGKQPGMTHIGCWAHIRREFHHVYVNQGKESLAGEMIELIKKLYVIEKRLRLELDEKKIQSDIFLIVRKKETESVFKEIREWLFANCGKIPPKSSLGEAIAYAMGQFDRAIRYVDHYLVTPDNNLVENAIRPFVIGRKNWLFYDTPQGAWAGATLYSILETAKANGHEPYKYLCYLVDKISLAKTDDELITLLPYVLDPNQY